MYTRRAELRGLGAWGHGQALTTSGWSCLAGLPSLGSLELPGISLEVPRQGQAGGPQLAPLKHLTSITAGFMRVFPGQEQQQQGQQQSQQQGQQQGQHLQVQGVLAASAPQLQQLTVHWTPDSHSLAAALRGHSSLASLAVYNDGSRTEWLDSQLSTLGALTQLSWQDSGNMHGAADGRADAIAADVAGCAALRELRMTCAQGLGTSAVLALAAGRGSSSLRSVTLATSSKGIWVPAAPAASLPLQRWWRGAALVAGCSGLQELALHGGWQQAAVVRDQQELQEALQEVAGQPAAELLRLAQAVAGSSSLAQQLLRAARASGAADTYENMEMEGAPWTGQLGGEGGDAAPGLDGGRLRAGRPCEIMEPFLAAKLQLLQGPEVLLQQLSDALLSHQEQQGAGGQMVAGQPQQQQPVAEVLQGVQQALALREQLVQACEACPSRGEVCMQVGQCKVVLTPPGGGTALVVLAEDSDEEW